MQKEVLERSIPLEKTDPTRSAVQVIIFNSFIIKSFLGVSEGGIYMKNPVFFALGESRSTPSNIT